MFKHVRTTGFAGGGAMLLVLSLSGVVAGLTLLADTLPVAPEPIADTTLTFEDTDGNGVDDDCQETFVPDLEAETNAQAAVDLDHDGVISVSEAAQSDRIGGKNCNHGGYVSIVAHGNDTCETPAVVAPEEGDASAIEVVAELTAPCDEPAVEEPAAEEAPAALCEAPAEPVPAPVTTETEVIESNAHGKAVSEVAKSDVVGGKNCNHGGAVSEVAKDKAAHDAAKAAAKAERDAAKALRKAAHDAAKALRKAARDAAKAARDGSRAAKHHGKLGG